MEFLNFRGQQLEATIVNVAWQEFVIAPIAVAEDVLRQKYRFMSA